MRWPIFSRRKRGPEATRAALETQAPVCPWLRCECLRSKCAAWFPYEVRYTDENDPTKVVRVELAGKCAAPAISQELMALREMLMAHLNLGVGTKEEPHDDAHA